MASINPYAEEKSHVLHVYDAPMAFQIHFCFTIYQDEKPFYTRKTPKTQPLQLQNVQHGTTFCPHMVAFSFFIPIFAIRHLHPFRHRTENQRGAPINTPVNKQL